MVEILRTPEERFENLPDYNFKANYLNIVDRELGIVRMHYLDEGSQYSRIALLFHGQPTW